MLRGSRERQAQTGTGQGRGGEFGRAGRLGETVGFAAPEDMMAGEGDTLGQPEGHWTVAREEIGQGGGDAKPTTREAERGACARNGRVGG